MITLWQSRGGHYAVLVAVGATLFLVNLGGASLWDIDEGKNATAALEMHASGNWIVPTFNGALRADKPALLYWLQVLAYRTFGVNEFAARLPSALAALAALLLVYELGRALFGKPTGFLGALVAASTPMLCAAARFANPDALLHLFTLLALLIFWLGHRQPTALWWAGLGAATGLGMLAKGPVGLVLPAAAGFFYLLWERRLRLLLDRRIGWAMLTWCVVALPWYTLVGVETKANFLYSFFVRHNFQRFGDALEGHGGSPLYYVLVLLIGTAPWSLFAGGTMWWAMRSARRQLPRVSDLALPAGVGPLLTPNPAPQGGEGDTHLTPPLAPSSSSQEGEGSSAFRFLLAWIATYLVFFSVAATKLPNYILPVVAPCALLIASFLQRWRRDELPLAKLHWVLALCGLMLLGAGITLAMFLASGPGNLPALSGHSIPGLERLAWIGAVPVVGGLVCWVLWRRQRRDAVVVSLTLTALGIMAPLAILGSAAAERIKAPRLLVERAGARQLDVDLRIGAWQLGHLPSLNFYTQRNVIVLRSEGDLRGLLQYPLPVIALLPASIWDACAQETRALGRELAREHEFQRRIDVVVVANRLVEASPAPGPTVAGGRVAP